MSRFLRITAPSVNPQALTGYAARVVAGTWSVEPMALTEDLSVPGLDGERERHLGTRGHRVTVAAWFLANSPDVYEVERTLAAYVGAPDVQVDLATSATGAPQYPVAFKPARILQRVPWIAGVDVPNHAAAVLAAISLRFKNADSANEALLWDGLDDNANPGAPGPGGPVLV